jgi:NADPH:quinone reductase-like Zn-dependent oxidoreductase
MVGGEGGGRVLGGSRKWLHALMVAPLVSQRLRPLATKPNKLDLLLLKVFAESGQLRPAIARTFRLGETSEAFHFMAKAEARGKVVITM